MKKLTYGYARISTTKQKLERQIDNIKRDYPDAIIITEKYTGTTTDRPAWNNLMEQIKEESAKGTDITIVFDEVSRMSRDAAEGMKLYEELFNMGCNLIFIKEPHVNTKVYRDKLNRQIEKLQSTGSKATDKFVETMMNAMHEYTIDIAKEQIEIAFQTAETEVKHLHQRTSEGVRKAQAAGKKVGRAKGTKAGIDFKVKPKVTKKSIAAKETIRKYSKDFEGKLTDTDCMALAKVSRNTFYKYKRELQSE